MSLVADYGRAFAATLPLAGRLPLLPGGGGELPPDLVRERSGVQIDRAHLAQYARVCGFTLRDALPATYLNVLAFPVHIALMTDPRMPFGPVGLVHVTNEITQHRPVLSGETLDLRVGVSGLHPHPKGRTLTLHTEWRAGAELVWSGESTMLRRGRSDSAAGSGPTLAERRGGDADAPSGPAIDAGELEPQATWTLPGDLGRRYAAVSGDRNPIHLYGLTAKAFGFPRQIVHGLWTKARCVAAVESELPDSFGILVRFRTPILLPSTVTFAAHEGLMTVRDAASGAPHLDGKVSV